MEVDVDNKSEKGQEHSPTPEEKVAGDKDEDKCIIVEPRIPTMLSFKRKRPRSGPSAAAPLASPSHTRPSTHQPPRPVIAPTASPDRSLLGTPRRTWSRLLVVARTDRTMKWRPHDGLAEGAGRGVREQRSSSPTQRQLRVARVPAACRRSRSTSRRRRATPLPPPSYPFIDLLPPEILLILQDDFSAPAPPPSLEPIIEGLQSLLPFAREALKSIRCWESGWEEILVHHGVEASKAKFVVKGGMGDNQRVSCWAGRGMYGSWEWEEETGL